MSIEKNTVSAEGQVRKNNYIGVFEGGGNVKVLFLGNSITRHEPKPEIGWDRDWGMAASKRENDYVHVTVKLLEEKLGKVDYCIANCGEWELHYYDDERLSAWSAARDFGADIVVVRLGENIWAANTHFAETPIAPCYAKMVEYFCSNPKAKVVTTTLFWPKAEIDEAIYSVAEEKGYTLVRLGDLGALNENMAIGEFAHEGVALHPNDLGMRRIAERIAAAICEE